MGGFFVGENMKEQEGQKLSKKDFLIITTFVAVGILALSGIYKVESGLLEELLIKNPEAFYTFINLIKR